MIKIQKQVCECCGGSSFKNIGENKIQCEYCDTVYVTDKDSSERKVGFEMNPNDYYDRFRDDIERINKEAEETYNRCVEIEVKRKKLNRLFLILMIVSLVFSGLTGGVSAPFSLVFLFCIVWNDSRQKTRNAQAFIKQYLSERVQKND